MLRSKQSVGSLVDFSRWAFDIKVTPPSIKAASYVRARATKDKRALAHTIEPGFIEKLDMS